MNYHYFCPRCGNMYVSREEKEDLATCMFCNGYPPEAVRAMNEEGRKYDQEKNRWDLVPWDALNQIVEILTYGAKKYDDENWRKVPEGERRYFAAALRHIVSWKLGEKLDPETKKNHLAHAACCLLFMLGLDKGAAK